MRCYDGAYVGHFLDPRFVRLQQAIQCAEVIGERHRRGFADIANTQRVQEPR